MGRADVFRSTLEATFTAPGNEPNATVSGLSSPLNLVFVKLHKISGTTAAYDLYTALNRTQRTFHNMHKGEYTPAAYAARRCGSRGVTCAFLQHSNLELYARFGSELLKPFLRSLANQQQLKDGFQSPEPSHLVWNSSSATAGLTAGGGDHAPNHAPAVTTTLLREPVSACPASY